MKMQELRQLTPKKLETELKKAQHELMGIKFQVRTGKNQNTAEIHAKRTLVARILTLLNSKSPSLSSPKK